MESPELRNDLINDSNTESPELKNNLILAPMAGVTDDAFRRLCLEQGAAMVYSEMVSAKALCYDDRKSLEMLAHSPEGEPIAYQLFGAEPDVMAEAVKKLDAIEAGRSEKAHLFCSSKHISCISYDVNMGCPVRKVVRNGEGAALMRDVAGAARIVEAMTRATDKPVTVKFRSGWDATDAVSGMAVEFARAMEKAGAAALAVHGRTREQYYSGKADWNVIARVKEAVGVPVAGSGDVMSEEDAELMQRKTGCDYVMVARGALGNPWIFRNAYRPTAKERALMFMRHARMVEENKGEYIAVREMRKHTGWYFKGLPGVSALRARVNSAGTLSELTDLVTEAFI
jgi:nifR3 family TIM-barrel protein